MSRYFGSPVDWISAVRLVRIKTCFLLLHVSFVFECLMYFLFIILYYVYDFIINK